MADNPMIPDSLSRCPAPQYTIEEAISVCLAMCERCVAEVRALSLMPGPQGEKGDRGETGKPGTAGERGAKGEPGRNAADLALLQEGINERIEQMFRAAPITTNDGGRTLLWEVAGTVHAVKTAVVLDAGIWKDGTVYAAGDGVTHGGSWWIAKAETSTKPGKSDEWRLAVKRGNDGRDYRAEGKAQQPLRLK